MLLHSALIWVLSSGPVPEFVREEVGAHDKLAHLGAYVAWGALCAWPLSRTLPSLSAASRVLLAALLGLLYGISDEIHQSFVPSRSADPWDAAFDGVGSLLGALLFALACKFPRKP